MINEISFSKIIISTAFGPSGRGLFPYILLPNYRKLQKLVKEKRITVIAKSATRNKRVGNFQLWKPWTWKYIQRLKDGGMLNAYGLTNSGVEKCAEKIGRSIAGDFNVVPSFYPELTKERIAINETIEAINLYRSNIQNTIEGLCGITEEEYFKVLELNISCPNAKEVIKQNMEQALACITRIKKVFPWLFLIIKTSIVHDLDFYPKLEKAGVDAIHAINTIPYNLIYLDKISPLIKVGGGGVSGGPAFEKALAHNKLVRKKVKGPLIMGCGITSWEDVEKYFDIGADFVSICTLALRNPKVGIEIIKKFC